MSMFCRVFIPLCFGLAVAHVSNQQESDFPNNITSGTRSMSLMQLKTFRRQSEVELAPEDLADMHAASSEQMGIAWERSNHALRVVKQKESEIVLAQYPGKTNGTNSSAAQRHHANASARYTQQLGNAVNETTCRACADAEQGLSEALTEARQGHIIAQNLAVALSEAHKQHEAAAKQLTDHHVEFVEEKTKLEKMMLTLKSSKTDFDTLVSIAQGLYPIVQLANQAELIRDVKTTSMQAAQKKYDHAAGAALQLDKKVAEKRRVEAKKCAAFGFPTKPPTTTTTTTTRACKDGDVRTSTGAAPVEGVWLYPEIFYAGTFYPICGHYFWDNNIGASTFCRHLGFKQGEKQRAYGVKFSKDAVSLGSCYQKDRFPRCTAGGNYWGKFQIHGCWCCKGKTIGVQVRCSGAIAPVGVSC